MTTFWGIISKGEIRESDTHTQGQRPELLNYCELRWHYVASRYLNSYHAATYTRRVLVWLALSPIEAAVKVVARSDSPQSDPSSVGVND